MVEQDDLSIGRVAMVIGANPTAAGPIVAIAQRFDDVRVLASGLSEAVRDFDDCVLPTLAVVDARDLSAEQLPDLGALVEGYKRDRVCVVVILAERQLDEVGAMLIGDSCVLLCDPDEAEIAGTLAVALAEAGLGLRESSVESARRQRIQEEVARFAATLSRIVDRDEGNAGPDTAPYVAERSGGFDPAEIAVDSTEIRRAIRARRMRDDAFGVPGLFEDPAWDMLLDLFAAELERRRVSVSSLCIAASVAPTTALRWIGKLIDAGLLERRPDAFDRRRAFISLHARASKAMQTYFAALRRAGLAIA